ncbi:YciI family protein [Candidatus Nitrospira salsa]
MKFAIIGHDGPEGPTKRPIYRPSHLQRLKTLDKQGRLILAGPFADQSGSLMVIDADSLAEAEAFAQEDPYTIHGVFQHVEVHPFTQVLPESSPDT